MVLTVKVPDRYKEEFSQQFYADQYYGGFNNETLFVEVLKELFGMETEYLRVE